MVRKKNFLEIEEMWGNISADIQNYLQTMSLSHKLYHSVLKLICLFFPGNQNTQKFKVRLGQGKQIYIYERVL